MSEQEEYQETICPCCNGSGEGMYDGTTCTDCRGSGVEKHNLTLLDGLAFEDDFGW